MSGDDNVRREAELWALHARAQAAEERALEAERQHDAVVDYAREELRLRQAEQRERRLTLAGLLQAYHTIDKLKNILPSAPTLNDLASVKGDQALKERQQAFVIDPVDILLGK
ncbi:hypothetical protein E4U48_000205, partial [Claviceps purpurea]